MNYLENIESEYSRIRGKWSPLSPMDWQLAQSWEDSSIPLHIVLTSMSDVFRQFEANKKGGKINSLSYFTQEVEKQFSAWKESQVGKSDEEFDYSSEDRHGFLDYDESEEVPVLPLSESTRNIVLESLRTFSNNGHTEMIKAARLNYTEQDWQWLMGNLEESK